MGEADAMTAGSIGDLAAAPSAASRGWVRWYVVTILALVYGINIADRYVVSTVMESIRLDLHLTDSGIAALTGVSLALFYVTAGIPVSMLADRANRRNIIAVSLVIWSAMTTCCGLAHTFWQMLAARIGVGIGEAGGTPPSTSMLADWFPARQRPMACAFYSLGAPFGAWVGADIAGWLADLYGWRAAFLGLGVPGVVLGVVIMLTIGEPKRGAMEPTEAAKAETPVTLRETLRLIWRHRSAVHQIMGGAVTALWGWGLMWWTPTYLMRAYGMTAGQAGGVLGPMHLVAGSLSLLVTGRILAIPAMTEPRRVLWLMAGVIGVCTVPSFLIFYTHDLLVAKICLWLFVPAMYFYLGPSFGLLQNVVPPRMRATTTAVVLLMANLGNLVIAPQCVGFISDYVGGAHGVDASSLRLALLILAPTGLWAAFHYVVAIRDYRADEVRSLSY